MPFLQSTPSPNNPRESRPNKWSIDGRQRVFLLGLLALVCAAILFGLRVTAGLQLFQFGDEAEKFVAAQMINQGLHLYRDVFAHHGPIPYMIAHLYVKFVSPTDFSLIRLSIVFLAVASSFSIFFSPVLKSFAARAWAAALYLSVLSSFWELQGILFLLYQPIGGFLFVIVLAQMVIPSLLGEKISRIGLFSSGFSLSIAFFSAYAFGPAAIFFVASTLLSLRVSNESLKKYAKDFFLGVVSATAIVMLWLISFADFIGYLIYHFYFNQHVYASFIEFSLRASIVNSFNVSFFPQNIVQTLAISFFATWVSALAFFALNKSGNTRDVLLKIGAIFFLAVAVLLINPRGEGGFHSAGFVIINIAAISLVAALLLQNQLSKFSWKSLVFPFAFMTLIIGIAEQVSNYASIGALFKKDFSAKVVEHKPEQSDAYDFVRSITGKNEKILSLIFNPTRYIKAGILPASGHFYYLPWQAAYNRVSILDYKIDICKDIETNRPTVIWFDDWKVWDKYSINQYEPCVPELIKSNYSRNIGDSTLYIRNDIALELMQDSSSNSYKIRSSPQLMPSLPIPLLLMSSDQAGSTLLKRIGVGFGTYARQNPGEAELRLKGPDGAEFIQRFSLPDLANNKYRYFDIDSKRYTSGEILSITGGGVSTLESHGENADSKTCIIYEYNNGKKRYTPGCPFY